MLLAGVGLVTPILVGCVFSAVFITHLAVNLAGNAGTGPPLTFATDLLSAIVAFSKFGLYFASVLAPLTAVAVPASYRAALFDHEPKPSLAAFLMTATMFGVIGPLVLEFVMAIVRFPLPPFAAGNTSGISIVYSFFGVVVAPLTALILWPIVRGLDRKCGTGVLSAES